MRSLRQGKEPSILDGANMLLYHGSNLEVPEPRLINQTRGLDYGAGFYLTTGVEQAKRFIRVYGNGGES
jgi:hypothetical protein